MGTNPIDRFTSIDEKIEHVADLLTDAIDETGDSPKLVTRVGTTGEYGNFDVEETLDSESHELPRDTDDVTGNSLSVGGASYVGVALSGTGAFHVEVDYLSKTAGKRLFTADDTTDSRLGASSSPFEVYGRVILVSDDCRIRIVDDTASGTENTITGKVYI